MAKAESITRDRLRELLEYDTETGLFRARRTGKIVGWENEKGYVIITIGGRNYRAHRLAWLYMMGQWPKVDVDHEDRTKSNNRWGNLRDATRSQNMGNQAPGKRNKSGIKGVSWDKKSEVWIAYCKVGGVCVLKESFRSKEDAAEAYAAAAKKHFGEFARLR